GHTRVVSDWSSDVCSSDLHERMHRTLKAQTSRPPAANAAEQQARFDTFRQHYNEERPHEALGQQLPAELYPRPRRAMPARMEDPKRKTGGEGKSAGARYRP